MNELTPDIRMIYEWYQKNGVIFWNIFVLIKILDYQLTIFISFVVPILRFKLTLEPQHETCPFGAQIRKIGGVRGGPISYCCHWSVIICRILQFKFEVLYCYGTTLRSHFADCFGKDGILTWCEICHNVREWKMKRQFFICECIFSAKTSLFQLQILVRWKIHQNGRWFKPY